MNPTISGTARRSDMNVRDEKIDSLSETKTCIHKDRCQSLQRLRRGCQVAIFILVAQDKVPLFFTGKEADAWHPA